MGSLAGMLPLLVSHGVELMFACALLAVGAAGARSSQLGGWTLLLASGGVKVAQAAVGGVAMYLIFHRDGVGASSLGSRMMMWNGAQYVLGLAFYGLLLGALVSLQRSLGAPVRAAVNRPAGDIVSSLPGKTY